MGKVVATRIAPKRFAHSSTRIVLEGSWDERRFMDWVQGTCVGTVWYDAQSFEPYGSSRNPVSGKPHHKLLVWFSKKADAMLFKLTYE